MRILRLYLFGCFLLLFISRIRAKLEETKLKQKLRLKPNGVNVIGLAIGQKVNIEDVITKVSSDR